MHRVFKGSGARPSLERLVLTRLVSMFVRARFFLALAVFLLFIAPRVSLSDDFWSEVLTLGPAPKGIYVPVRFPTGVHWSIPHAVGNLVNSSDAAREAGIVARMWEGQPAIFYPLTHPVVRTGDTVCQNGKRYSTTQRLMTHGSNNWTYVAPFDPRRDSVNLAIFDNSSTRSPVTAKSLLHDFFRANNYQLRAEFDPEVIYPMRPDEQLADFFSTPTRQFNRMEAFSVARDKLVQMAHQDVDEYTYRDWNQLHDSRPKTWDLFNPNGEMRDRIAPSIVLMKTNRREIITDQYLRGVQPLPFSQDELSRLRTCPIAPSQYKESILSPTALPTRGRSRGYILKRMIKAVF